MAFGFAIAGASKCGSSFLHECLMANPQISMPAREVFEFHPRYYSRTAMHRLRAEVDRTRMTGVKRPNLMFDYRGMELLRREGCRRIIIVLRDPVVRAISHFYHLRRYAQVAFVSFDEMADALVCGDIQRLKGQAFEIEAETRYSDAVANARRLVGPENVLLISFERMTAAPAATLAVVARFVGVPIAPLPAMPAIPQKVIYADAWQRLWAASCRIEGVCDEDNVVVAYRKQPLAPGRQRRIESLRAAAHQHRDHSKPTFPSVSLDRIRAYFAGEYEFLTREGMTMSELERLRPGSFPHAGAA